uniref:Uncharacterized protein n=1 Tax=Adineta vaga TaxID=104782 RepID=B3G480_ADIVA|nr:unknown [Adineta vaga]
MNYETTRIGCLLVHDGKEMWEDLTLSKSMIFPSNSSSYDCVIVFIFVIIFLESNDTIGDIDIIVNDRLIETITVRMMKRKPDLNTSETIVKRNPVNVKRQKNVRSMDIRNSQTDQYNQNHNDSSTSLAPEQSNNRNCENMYLQHDCAASFHPIVNATNSSVSNTFENHFSSRLNGIILNCEMIPPSMNNNYTYNILQSESSTAAIHSYNHPLYENNDQVSVPRLLAYFH